MHPTAHYSPAPLAALHHQRAPRQRQRGVALFVVIVFVMLSMLLALWAARTSLFNEMVVGNDADYQRAFEAAQAMLQDAELDIRGERPDGSLCTQSPCRYYNPDSKANYPAEGKDINPLITKLQTHTDAQDSWCVSGLCARRTGRIDFWNKPTGAGTGEFALDKMLAAGVPYGKYTGAQTGAGTNPLLKDNAWYWIEIIPYNDNSNSNLIVGASSNALALNLDVYVVYRITALAKGRKPGTMVVLQETYARQRKKD